MTLAPVLKHNPDKIKLNWFYVPICDKRIEQTSKKLIKIPDKVREWDRIEANKDENYLN